MAIKCHSSFVHYNMFHNNHCHGGGNNYGSIFNITNNCGGGHTNFWGGLGAGLGYGLGGMFSGLLGGFMGGFGNMFGGFGMNMFGGFGNMFGGFGFGNMFGGLSGLWGGGNNGSYNYDDYSRYSSHRHSRSCNCSEKTDIDNAKIASLTTKIKNLTPGSVSDEDYNKIKSEIEAAKAATDSINKTNDELTYDNLLDMLNDYKNNTVKPAVAEIPESENKATVKIGNDDVAIDTLTLDIVKAWTPANISGLSADDAIKVLEKLGYITGTGDNKVGSMSAEYNILLLLQQSGVNVKCAENKSSVDTTIEGKITDVKLIDGKLSYSIDNKTVSTGMFKYKYTFQQVADKNGKKCFQIIKIDKNNSAATGYVDKNWQTRDYIFENEKSPLQVTGIPLVSTKSGSDRIELTDKLEKQTSST